MFIRIASCNRSAREKKAKLPLCCLAHQGKKRFNSRLGNRNLSIPRLRIRKGKASKNKAGRPILRQERKSLTEKAGRRGPRSTGNLIEWATS